MLLILLNYIRQIIGRILHAIACVLFGLSPLAVVSIFGLVIYQQLPNLTGIAIIGSLDICAIAVGLKIFFL